jgi:hypothetical protein
MLKRPSNHRPPNEETNMRTCKPVSWLSFVALLAAGCAGEVAGDGDPATAQRDSASCSFTVTQNVYDAANWWGTIAFKNTGSSSSSNWQVSFNVPSGVHCDFAQSGWTYSQSGSTCIYKKPGVSIAAGASLTLNYSTDSQAFNAATSVAVSDGSCSASSGGGSPSGGSSGGSCSFSVTQNVYDSANWWGTIAFKNNGPQSSSNWQVSFNVPSGVQCDFAQSGWTYSQSGSTCIYKKPGTSLAAGASLSMSYSTDSQGFSAATSVVVSDASCGAAGGGSPSPMACSPETAAAFCAQLGKNCGTVSGTDNCHAARTASCGSCAAPASCGGGGTANVCGGGNNNGNGGGTQMTVNLTSYAFNDNDNGAGMFGTAVIAYPIIHMQAFEGSGAFNDPVTFATDANELAPGTIVYIPYLQKYFIMEDGCVECTADWQRGIRHIDLWMGPDSMGPQPALANCEDSITRTDTIYVNAQAGYPVDTTPMFSNGMCTVRMH